MDLQQGCQNNSAGEKIIFLANNAGATEHPHIKKINLDTEYILFKKLPQNHRPSFKT